MQNESICRSIIKVAPVLARRLLLGSLLLAAAALVPRPAAAHVIPTGDTDYELFRACFGQTPAGHCAPMDINGDGRINVIDYAHLRNAVRYDLSGDLIVDYVNAPDNADLNIFRGCYGREPVAGCKTSDFNTDGAINGLDLGLFRSGLRFDFNADGKFDFRMAGNRAPFLDPLHYVPTTFKIARKKKFGLYLVARDHDNDAITYTFDRGSLPENAKLHKVIYGDVNKDGVVDQNDVDLIAAAIGGHDPRLDLDDSGSVGERDSNLAFYAIGTQREAYYFSWKPEDDQAGTYTLAITVTDQHGDSNLTVVTLEVVD